MQSALSGWRLWQYRISEVLPVSTTEPQLLQGHLRRHPVNECNLPTGNCVQMSSWHVGAAQLLLLFLAGPSNYLLSQELTVFSYAPQRRFRLQQQEMGVCLDRCIWSTIQNALARDLWSKQWVLSFLGSLFSCMRSIENGQELFKAVYQILCYGSLLRNFGPVTYP